ncbi:bifunctional oligoribonuclease/PAP phosphatase NrnA [Candidatus Omnitrophota bacterium]
MKLSEAYSAANKRMRNLSRATKAIVKAKTIAIACHINPDGDTLGSLLSLGLGLKKLGKRVYMLSPDAVPSIYQKLPGASQIIRKTDKAVDLAIAVDCGDKELLGSSFAVFTKAKKTLAIDHHEFRVPFSNIRLVDPQAAAAGELIYALLRALSLPITKNIAQNIMTSIIVETNSFRLPNIRPRTFTICAKLLATGINFYALSKQVYWSKTKPEVLLEGLCLRRIKFTKNSRLCWAKLTLSDFKKFKAKPEDADSLANDLLSIKNVEITILFREQEKGILRVSLRSKGRANVAKLAKEHGGGGHHDASGCTIPNTRRVIEQLLTEAKALL